ncbi:MAG: class A beta-lactamase [Phycisphaerae bacterium]
MKSRLHNRTAIIFCLLLFFGGCTAVSRSDSQKLVKLQRNIEQFSCRAEGRVGVAICLLETYETIDIAGDERFPMQSVYKMPIAMAVLHNVDVGCLHLDECIEVGREELAAGSLYSPIRDKFPSGTKLTVRQLIHYAVSESDNVACDILLHLAGGPQCVTDYLRGLGLDEVMVATTEREMTANNALQYRNWATPRGALKMLAVFHAGAGLSPQSHAVLNEALAGVVTGPRRIKGLLPPGTTVVHKTGTSGTMAGRTAATNDIGIITLPNGKHLAIAVFINDSAADIESRESTIARIARAAYDFFTQRLKFTTLQATHKGR